jgi:integrase
MQVNGNRVYAKPETDGDGIFYLSWYEGTKRRREAIQATTLRLAHRVQDDKQKDLDAIERLKDNGTYAEPEETSERLLLADAVETYLAEIKAHKSAKTLNAYTKALEYFQASCTKKFVDSIDRKDLMAFKTYLADERNQSPRSVWNKFSAVMGFMKQVGRNGKAMGLDKKDWPQYANEMPVVYKDAELAKLYAACTEDEARWFRFFELTGMREGEVQHCQWSWIEWGDMEEAWIDVKDRDKDTVPPTIIVQPNMRRNWKPKKNKRREFPMSRPLYELLKSWQAKANSTCDLVFPTSGCNVKLDFLDCLKAVAKRAKLFCGKCDGCKQDVPNCEKWFLHKFRSTFGTKVLRKTDTRTAMEWLGHTDMASTLRYLRPAEGNEAQSKMDAVFG